MKRNTIIIGIVVTLVLIAAALFGLQRLSASAATTSRVQTVTVERGTLVATVSAAGNVSAVKSAALAFQTTGRVTLVNAQVGDVVKAGQLLMQQDTSDLLLALKNAQAGLASAQANYDAAKAKNEQNSNQLIVAKGQLDKAIVTLQQAQANYNAIAWRGDVGATSQAAALQSATIDYQTALANFNLTAATINDSALRVAQASLDEAKVAQEQAQRNIDKARIIAPFDGVVAAVNFGVGDSAGASTAAITLADLSTLQVKVTLAEVDVSKVQVGQTAQMTLDALTGATYTAKVTAIGPVATVTQGVVNYPVIVSVTNTDSAIKPGMTANLAIQVDRRDNVLLLPTRAVRTQGNQKQVTVLYKGQSISTPITTGLASDSQIEVMSGLKEGDEVVVQQTTTRSTSFGPGGGGAVFFGR